MHEQTGDATARGADAAVPGTGELSRFTDLSGTRLYRRNIFAVTGLPADAEGRAVRRHRQRLEARLAVEETWPGDSDSPSAGGYRKDEVRAAFEEFQDPRRRLVDELLWRWGDTDFGCGCPEEVHRDHDEAVRLHALALHLQGRSDGPAYELDDVWAGAGVYWGELLERPEFRRHIDHRITALNDPRLGEYTAGDFLAGLPRLLVSPFPELAADAGLRPRLSRVCGRWAEFGSFADDLSELFEDTVEQRAEKIYDGLRSAEDKRAAREYGEAVAILREQVVPEYEGLDAFGPFVPEWRRDELAHAVAVTLNNMAVALQAFYMGKVPNRRERTTVVELVEKAYEIAPDRDADDIKQNWDVIYEQFTSGGQIPTGLPVHSPYESTSTGRDCLFGLLTILVIVGLIVQAIARGVAEAFATGLFLAFVVGVPTKIWEWVTRVRDWFTIRRSLR